MTQPNPLRVAVIGCGRISEIGHMRAIMREPACSCSLLVDTNEARTRELALSFGVAKTATDYRDAPDHADACIVALPHDLHAEASVYLLERGMHVLIEKPMAMNVAECEAMIAAAEKGKASLAVGLQRRFIHSVDLVKAILDQGLLGQLRSFDYREGSVYRWQLASDFLLRKETAGGGVLFDTGAHALDLLLYWLGDVAEVEYKDDNCGGIESESELRLTMASGVTGELSLSRIRQLRNTVIFRGERGTLEVAAADNLLKLHLPEGDYALAGYGAAGNDDAAPSLSELFSGTAFTKHQSLDDLYLDQLRDWLASCRGDRSAKVSGTDGLRAIALMERCYANAGRIDYPWMQPQ